MKVTFEGSPEEVSEFFQRLSKGDISDLLPEAAASEETENLSRIDDTDVYNVLNSCSNSSFYLISLLYNKGKKAANGKELSFSQLLEIGGFESPRHVSNRVGGVNKVAQRLGVPSFLKVFSSSDNEKLCLLTKDSMEGVKYCLEQWKEDFSFWCKRNHIIDPGSDNQ